MLLNLNFQINVVVKILQIEILYTFDDWITSYTVKGAYVE